ncbi:MAG: lyase family protein [Candidatus Caldarchaeum sp.]
MTPVDGRYREKLHECSKFFSEKTLIHYRLLIETKYLTAFLKAIGNHEDAAKAAELEKHFTEFSVEDAAEVKKIEELVGHDVVAAAKFLEKKLEEHGLLHLKPFIHYGLTSEDVNNIAYALAISGFLRVLTPALKNLTETLVKLAETHASTLFLARTHGQPAVPTTFGSFIANYAYRIAYLTRRLKTIKLQAKIGGAVGDLSALKTTYPEVDWHRFAEKFVENLGFEYNPASTQIIPHERTSEILQTTALAAAVVANLCRDMWLLGMLGHITFERKTAEIHSSTMPQKKNPLMFENAEGAADLASHLLNYMATRLISSRLHRDLSDSVIKRFYGTAFALVLLAVKNTTQALQSMHVDAEAMKKEVENNPQALAEAIQLSLRKQGIENAYQIAGQMPPTGPALIKTITEKYIESAVEKTTRLLDRTKKLMA